MILAWSDKGGILSNLKRFNEAVTCYNKALELDNKNKYAWNNKGSILKKMNKTQEALDCFNKALELDPDYERAKELREELLTSKSSF